MSWKEAVTVASIFCIFSLSSWPEPWWGFFSQLSFHSIKFLYFPFYTSLLITWNLAPGNHSCIKFSVRGWSRKLGNQFQDNQWVMPKIEYPNDQLSYKVSKSDGVIFYLFLRDSLGNISSFTIFFNILMCLQLVSMYSVLRGKWLQEFVMIQHIHCEHYIILARYNWLIYPYSFYRDGDSFDLRKRLPFSVGLLLRLLKKNHRVFVTCTTGFDRSPACVIAYLHWMTDTPLHAAHNFVTGLHTCKPDRYFVIAF